MRKHTPLSNPTRSDRRHRRANFARDAVIAEFGARHARALDQGDFVDRLPGEMPMTRFK